jgi:hypothetical protein
MQFFITMAVCAALLFIPGGDYLIVPAILVSIFIGHLRNKHERSKRQ